MKKKVEEKKELDTGLVQITQRNYYANRRRKNRGKAHKSFIAAAATVSAVAVLAACATIKTLGSNGEESGAVCAEIPPNYYPLTTVVSEINHPDDLVVIRTSSGIEYQFHGIDDWWYGDICSCIMDDNGTGEVTDDIIVQKRYGGVAASFILK